jgi:hypothetical protein
MRFKRCTLLLFLALIAPSFSNDAFANSVTLTCQFQSQSNYYFSINGSSTCQHAFADQASAFVTLRHRTAEHTVGIALPRRGNRRAAGALTTLQAQWAVGGLFPANAKNEPRFVNYGGANSNAIYRTLSATASDSAYSGLLVYSHCARLRYEPQEYIGSTAVPEPSCITLFGTGLLALVGALHHKYSKS